ncbi:LysR family transcriptional regulator [Paenibacillus sp. TRM 82003]|uniref:LysR family transcriptional regulator n=1 Tax=Kineococcus sp. TRM81007 TaxID=2925831 RepID=UPI001F5A1EA4|nr:LysR family transcriptional regulator [Kineococcus sp. TRM81007]MCI2239966.1 LysR family transcriptional regulator [Kineococcus sp. TRM81007]MCI3925729.1 LysR family transcriptional regulator [Paenibacillus sp. TRM 82003]
MTPLQLRCALAVAGTLHFTRAAHEVGIAQSALSAHVARLEDELGTALFERTSRSVRLTSAGEALLPRARAVLAELDRLRTDVAAATGAVEGPLRIGTIPTLADVDLAGLLARLREQHPGVRATVVEQTSARTVADVVAGTLDVGFTGTALSEPPVGVQTQVITTEPLVAVVAEDDPWARRHRLRLREVARRPGVDFPAGTSGRRQSDEAFAAAGLARDVAVESSSAPFLLDLVRAGVGVALLPAAAARTAGGVRAVAVADAPVRRVCAVHAGAGSSAAARAFLALLAAHLPA